MGPGTWCIENAAAAAAAARKIHANKRSRVPDEVCIIQMSQRYRRDLTQRRETLATVFVSVPVHLVPVPNC